MTLSFNIDLFFFGISNFLCGNFSGVPPNISSNLSINSDGVNNCYFFLVTDNLPYDSSSYGQNIEKSGLYYGSLAVNSVTSLTDETIYLNDIVSYGNYFIPLTKISKSENMSNGRLLRNSSSVGDGLLQAVSSALFKKIGKNAAILNDTELISNLNNSFSNSLSNQISEINQNFTQSNFFQLYYSSDRFNENNINLNGDTNYILNDTIINFNLNLSGHVSDQGGDILFNENINSITQMFGNYNVDHKVSTSYGSVGVYDIKLFISLKHDNRF